MANSQWSGKRDTDFKNHWIFSLLGGFLGGIVLVAVIVLMFPYIVHFRDVGLSASMSGLIATVLGSLAALLGVAIATVFAIQWLFLEHRITNALKDPVSQMQVEMRVEFRKRHEENVKVNFPIEINWAAMSKKLDRPLLVFLKCLP